MRLFFALAFVPAGAPLGLCSTAIPKPEKALGSIDLINLIIALRTIRKE